MLTKETMLQGDMLRLMSEARGRDSVECNVFMKNLFSHSATPATICDLIVTNMAPPRPGLTEAHCHYSLGGALHFTSSGTTARHRRPGQPRTLCQAQGEWTQHGTTAHLLVATRPFLCE